MAGSVGQADFVMPKYSLEAVATIPLSNRSGFQEGSPWGAERLQSPGWRERRCKVNPAPPPTRRALHCYAFLASRNQFFVCLHGHFGTGF
jgi:hypothetical protein